MSDKNNEGAIMILILGLPLAILWAYGWINFLDYFEFTILDVKGFWSFLWFVAISASQALWIVIELFITVRPVWAVYTCYKNKTMPI